MTWLLKLYPPRWQRRYGTELAELVRAQRLSIGGAIDLMAGAIDAWFHPELIPATPGTKGETPMIARMMHFKCAGYGPDITASDKFKSTAVAVGGTLALALLWLWAVWQFRKNAYVLALGPMTFFFPYFLSMRYTVLKGRSTRTQTILIAGISVGLTALFLLIEWVGKQL